jgi:hypothetical protein
MIPPCPLPASALVMDELPGAVPLRAAHPAVANPSPLDAARPGPGVARAPDAAGLAVTT